MTGLISKILDKIFRIYSELKKSSFYKNIVRNESTSSSKLWIKLDPYLNPNKISKVSPSLIINDTYFNTPKDIAMTFSNFFSSVTNSFSFLGIDDCSNFINNHFLTTPLLNSLSNSDPGFNFVKFSAVEVHKALLSLRSSSAAGFVGIETRVFIDCASELKDCLTDLFNLCLSTGIFYSVFLPDDWKVAFLTPIYKGKGSKFSLDNYRPISILSPISKVFENLLSFQLRHFFKSNGIFSSSQFGLRKFLSCEIALNSMLDRWGVALDDRKYFIAMFLDLSKAFDTIDHELLLLKLTRYGFSSLSIQLIRRRF
jgi:hypothetical protein